MSKFAQNAEGYSKWGKWSLWYQFALNAASYVITDQYVEDFGWAGAVMQACGHAFNLSVMDQWTDKASHIVACPQLKIDKRSAFFSMIKKGWKKS